MKALCIPGRCLGLVMIWLLVLAGPAPAASYAPKADPSAELFTNAAIRHLRIEISDENLAILRQPVARNRNSGTRPSVPVTVREGEFSWTNVALHLKGSLGSFRPVDDRPALTLNFDKHAEKQRFHGLEKISLNNSVQDPSYVIETVTREMYRAAGVPVPRTDFATVELNGRPLGLYVLVEGWNKQFLKRHFANARGNFYDLGGGRDVSSPKVAAFGTAPEEHTALQALSAAANEPDHAKRLTRLRATVDLDRFISQHALDVLMWNWDGYALNKNNYRLFHDLDADRVVFFPHGIDQMFTKPNGPIVTGRNGLVARALLETSEGRVLYLQRLRTLRRELLDGGQLTDRVAAISRRIQPALTTRGLAAVANQQASARRFTSQIQARLADVDAQLASLERFTSLPLNQPALLTNWTSLNELGEITFNRTASPLAALRVHVRDTPSVGLWNTLLWLEEGRYRIEGRVRTLGVNASADTGAGFRVWSSRKDTRGPSWSWFPYATGRDPLQGGILPVLTNAPQQRLTGDRDWTLVTHEFELRQPLADLNIQCLLQATDGVAWFDESSLKIRRLSTTVSRSSKGD